MAVEKQDVAARGALPLQGNNKMGNNPGILTQLEMKCAGHSRL